MADGPGLRTSIYCSGCNHRCKGCHNPETWDINNGKEMSVDEVFHEIMNDTWSSGVTFTGGDPLYQSQEFTELAKMIKQYTNKDIMVYTGFTMDDILSNEKLNMIIPYVDFIVDGPFIEDLKDENLMFRGSSNQNIWHIIKGKPIKIKDFPSFE